MTTISGTADRTAPADRLLRVTLKVDAIAAGLTGLAFLGTSEIFKDLHGMPAAVAIPAGVFLLVFAAGVWLAAVPKRLNAKAVLTIIGLNIAWVVATVTVLATGALPLTTLGFGFAIVQAVAVAALAEIEFVGLRKATRGS